MSLPLNQIVEGDCLEVMQGFPSESVDLVVFDPPYNIGKAEWDRVSDYYGWILACFKEFNRILKTNGCLWLFHIYVPTIAKLNGLIEEKTEFRFKQFITINKGLQSIVGRTSENLRTFPRATEYAVFYTFEERANNPMATYLKAEIERSGVGFKEIAEAGHFYGNINHGGCVSNWVQGLSFPSEEQYGKMREYLNSKLVRGFLEKGYDFLKKEYEDLRYSFTLEKGITDVWDISFYETSNVDHPTVKPLRLLRRIVKATAKDSAIVLDPSCGSGTTCVASKMLGRQYIGIEINPEYCQIARKRLASLPQKLDGFMGNVAEAVAL